MPTMSVTQRDAFLAEPCIGVLGIAADQVATSDGVEVVLRPERWLAVNPSAADMAASVRTPAARIRLEDR